MEMFGQPLRSLRDKPGVQLRQPDGHLLQPTRSSRHPRLTRDDRPRRGQRLTGDMDQQRLGKQVGHGPRHRAAHGACPHEKQTNRDHRPRDRRRLIERLEIPKQVGLFGLPLRHASGHDRFDHGGIAHRALIFAEALQQTLSRLASQEVFQAWPQNFIAQFSQPGQLREHALDHIHDMSPFAAAILVPRFPRRSRQLITGPAYGRE